MKTSLKTTLILAVAATAAFMLLEASKNQSQIQEVQPQIQEAFQQWSMKNMRLYGTPSEQNFRLSVFATNYQKVQELKSQVTHQVGLTIFADLLEEEFLTKYTGFVPQNQDRKTQPTKLSLISESAESMPSVSLPEKVDHRLEGGLSTPVKNQRSCGSCWAFAAIASFESAYIKSTRKQMLFSEQQLVDCSIGYGNNGCAGGWMTFGYKYLKDHGAMKSTDYPYMAKDQTCMQKEPEYVASVLKYVELPEKDPIALKKAVAENVVSVAVDAKSWMYYTGGIIKENCDSKLNHGVVIVGYGFEENKDHGVDKYWIIKNSWGAGWGEKGYVRVLDTEKYGDGMCGINLVNSYVDIVIESH